MADSDENKINNENKVSQTNLEEVEQEIVYSYYAKKDIIGVNSKKQKNFLFLTENIILYISGLSFKILDLTSGVEKVYHSKNGGGIGCLEMHPNGKFFAIGEKGQNPNIYIYSYPEIEQTQVLQKGTEKQYSCLAFSYSGEKLASVGNSPDYSLIIWDWKNNKTILRVKAFSQEIYNVKFSKYNENMLCTVGMAHIKFWKIAKTFTGLKLKGEIGKFGQIELSDISALSILQDGKVISGSENGYFLLWEGNFIKAVLRKFDKSKCHEGNIEALKIIKDKYLLSAGDDNYLKLWDLNQITNVMEDEELWGSIEPLREIQLSSENKVHITNIQTQFLDEGLLFLQNERGNLIKLSFRDIEKSSIDIENVYEFNSGTITSSYIDSQNIFLSFSQGSILQYNFETGIKQKIIDYFELTSFNVINNLFITGNEKGLLRVMDKNFKLINTIKVFDQAIKQIQIVDEFLICIAKNEIFVIQIIENNELQVQFLYKIDKGTITCAIKSQKSLIFGLSSGEIIKFNLISVQDNINEKNYQIDQNLLNEFKGKLRMSTDQKPKQDENDIQFVLNDKIEVVDVEWDPQSIKSMVEYIPEADFDENQSGQYVIVSSECEFIGYVYLIKLQKDFKEDSQNITRPIKIIQTRNQIVTKMIYEQEMQLLLWGYDDGVIEIRDLNKISNIKYRMFGHDQSIGQIQNMFISKQNFISIGEDCSIVFYDLLKKDGEEIFGKEKIYAIYKDEKLVYEDENQLVNGYSLQQEKIQAVKDQKIKDAEQYKKDLKEKIKILKSKFKKLKQKNQDLDECFRLSEDQLIFDKQYNEYLKSKIQNHISEIEKEVEYTTKINQMKLNKIKQFYFSDISCESFGVSKLTQKKFVYSIKLKKITDYMINELDKICQIIEKEKNDIDEDDQSMNKEDNNIKTKELLEILKDIKQKYSDNKNLNYFMQMKNKIKDECRSYQTIEKMREYKKLINMDIQEIRKLEPSIKNVENSEEIIEAKENFGNYILKSSQEFKVSDENRINIYNLQTQILLMEKFIYNSCKTFNNTLIQLKEQKLGLIKKIENANSRIQQINNKLGIQEDHFEYYFNDSVENTSQRIQINEKEIQEYMKKKNEKQQNIYEYVIDQKQTKSQKIKETFIQNKERKQRLKNNQNFKIQKLRKIFNIKLNSEKLRIKTQIEKDIKNFDDNVEWTIEERVKLKYELKMAEMKILELFRNLLEIEIYEQQDNNLLKDLVDQREILKEWNEKKTINATKLKNLEEKEQNFRKELENITEEFREKVFPNEQEKSEYVYNYYKLHYKGNIDKDNIELNDNDQDEDINNIDNDKKDWILTVEQNDEWIDLLKQRRQAEDNISFLKEDKVILDNECTKIEEKITQIQNNLNQIKQNIDLLQLIKQKKINQLSCSFILSLDLIYLQPPLDSLKNIIIFTEKQFLGLKNKIIQLKQECKEIDVEKNQLLISQDSLSKELVLLRYSKKKAKEELKENFHLKFGKVIDLKILDSLKQTKRLKDLKQELKETEKTSKKKIEEAKQMIHQTKNELFELKKKNTDIIKRITALGTTMLKLNKTLDSTNKHIFKNEENSNKENIQSYKKDLISIIKLLNQELDELKNEIVILKNKGITM